jgi:hypothetical protein
MISTVEKKYDNENNFVCYNVVTTNNVHLSVPLDEANKDYQAIQEWIAEGNEVIDNGA